MEQLTQQSGRISKLDIILQTLLLVILIGQIFLLGIMSTVLEPSKGLFAIAAAMGVIFVLVPMGLVSAVISIILLKRKTSKALAITCLLLSIVSVVPPVVFPLTMLVSPIASPVFQPVLDNIYWRKLKRNDRKYEESVQALYTEYKETMRDPKEVVAIKSNQLLLNDGRVVILAFTDGVARPEFEVYVEENLILNKKPILVMLPPYDKFRDQYSGGASLFYDYKKPDDKLYRQIPALIFVDGKLLNLMYTNMGSVREIEYQGSLELLKEYERNGYLP